MGMEGELVLDWQAHEKLIHMGFCGFSQEIKSLLPERVKNKFIQAFPADDFTLQATLARCEGGLELGGNLSILDEGGANPRADFWM